MKLELQATILILLNAISMASQAQTSSITLEKAGVKKYLPNLSYIPAKTFVSLSHSGSDSVSNYESRISSVSSFYLGQTEVTNKEYREFVQYVKDSIAHRLLDHTRDNGQLDWSKSINWNDEKLVPLIFPKTERLYGRMEIDARRVYYEVSINGEKEKISVSPDTLVWINDFTYSYNEPMVKKYFSIPQYDQYPVVGISLQQAMAFCHWKTRQVNNKMGGSAKYKIEIRLPNNSEWEAAAYGEKESMPVVLANQKFNWNSGPVLDQRGQVIKENKDDGFFYTNPVKSYPAGEFGLFDMRGNVSEWTSTSRDEIIGSETKNDKTLTYFIVKGGGWNSTPYYMQPGVCQFFKSTETHSFIGFRYLVFIRPK